MNITLIGMPGSGKSSVGRELAERLDYNFFDIDEIIEEKTGLRLQQIIDKFGDEEFLKIEEKAILELGELEDSVIAPGGSIIYCTEAMKFLKRISTIVFLNSSFKNIQRRLANRDARGIVGLKKKDLRTLFDERMILYKKYADIEVEMPEKLDFDFVIKTIIQKISEK